MKNVVKKENAVPRQFLGVDFEVFPQVKIQW